MSYHRRMNIFDQLKTRLNALPNLREVARRTGLPEKTIYRTASGVTRPRIDTVQKIVDAVADIEREGSADKATA